MENQHRKIAGYRELSEQEIDLMNRIKSKGAELLELHKELSGRIDTDLETKRDFAANPANENQEAHHRELMRFAAAEPWRWAAIAKTDIETAIMAMVRAVAQPS